MATPTLSEFRNEPYADFSVAENRQAMEAALAKVRSEFGREYQLRIGGEWIATGDKLVSVNPSNPQEVVGIHHKATAGKDEYLGRLNVFDDLIHRRRKVIRWSYHRLRLHLVIVWRTSRDKIIRKTGARNRLEAVRVSEDSGWL